MEVDIQELVNNKVIGNVRSGSKGKDDRPIKYPYFDVHIDKSTSEMAVEIFNKLYSNPKSLKIRFLNQNPIHVNLERYEGKKRRCIGNNKQAELIDDKGKTQIIECNEKKCPFRQEKQCKYRGRLYFLIEGLEDDGIWCYPTGSEKGIRKICATIARANRTKEDLTKNWYELYLKEEEAPVKGKNYIPDIKKLELINTHNTDESKQENIKQNKNYLMLKSFMMTIINNTKVVKIKFVDTNKKEIELIIMPETNQEILNLKPGSIILPTKINETGNYKELQDYKIVKEVLNLIENKKAV